jgi:general stress protein 26
MQKTILDDAKREKIISFLNLHPVGVLACVDANGDPHASTIYFGVNNDLSINFTTKRDTMKYKNLALHNKVMLVVFDAARQAAVQVSGLAKEETDPEVAQKIYRGTLRAAEETGQDNVPPIAKIAAGPYVAFTIHPDDIQLSEYGWGDNFTNALKHTSDPDNTNDPA